MLRQPYGRYNTVCGPPPLPSCTHTVHGLVSKLFGRDESWTLEYFEDQNVNCSTLFFFLLLLLLFSRIVPFVSQENSS